ncbi:hypothetical protein ccbrp13_66890 [Ktedonobacteria bacterium brp13]|nr:hypothetical protein ccbrp13_66890 [Ktedonobacteria bacterium brp13]
MSVEAEESNDLALRVETGVETAQVRPGGRQRRSILEKIAFWTSLVGFLGGLGGSIAITVTSGAVSPSIIILAVSALISTVVLATGLRWAPLMSTLLGGYNLYLIFTEPFVIQSLSNPYGPNGGFPHFVMDVLVVACTITTFGTSLGAAVQNYRSDSRKAPRWLLPALGIVIGMIIGAIFIGALAHPVTAATTYTNGVATVHMNASSFAQSSVTIEKGAKVLLVDDTTAVHNLYNGSWQNGAPTINREQGAPLVNGLQVSGKSVTVGPFAIAGTYHILCAIHKGMDLTIIVH